MNTHTLHIRPHYFSLIQAGKKTVEGRTNKPKLQTIFPGDTLIFVHSEDPSQTLSARVTFVHRYPSFKKMLSEEGVDLCLPGIGSIEDAEALYHSFPGYEENAKLFGVIAIGIITVE
jgi:ASC-1-like (ASCH) protein